MSQDDQGRGFFGEKLIEPARVRRSEYRDDTRPTKPTPAPVEPTPPLAPLPGGVGVEPVLFGEHFHNGRTLV